jgi:hypothetical protein
MFIAAFLMLFVVVRLIVFLAPRRTVQETLPGAVTA